jgi:UDP-3-O-[3-hydroxymyristoyl] glucosamine N-acyltransferase
MAAFTLEEIARIVGGKPSEIPGPEVKGVQPLEYAGQGDITYVTGPKFLARFADSAAAAVMVPPGLEPEGRPWIIVGNPEACFARLTAVFYPYREPARDISPRAEVHPEATLGENVSVGPFAVIERAAVVGDNCVIGSHVVIGEEAWIGEATWIRPHATIYPRVRIGSRVIVHAGAVIGADGFGYSRDLDEHGNIVNLKKYHSGTVEISNDVELGALTAVDRALAGVTKVERGVKVDNLVQIAHSVTIGENTVIASQVGIAGSSTVGRNTMIGGQAGIRDHVVVGNDVILTARVSVYKNVPDGSVMAGEVPAMPHRIFLRAQSLFKKLPEMLERIRKLERLLPSNGKEI